MKYIILIFILLSLSFLIAEDSMGDNNLGFSAGELTRSGISYRHWTTDWGFQITGMMFSNKDDVPNYYDFRKGIASTYKYYGYGREFKTNFGFQIMKILQKVQNRRFYALAGYGFYHKERKIWESNDPEMDDAWVKGYSVENTHYWGIGAGFDLEIYEYLRVYLEIPVTFKSNNEITMYVPQIGVFYRF